MRTLRLLFTLSFVALFALACEDDKHNREELIDPWIRERTPISFKIQGQVGQEVIQNNWRVDSIGSISMMIAEDLIPDMTKVEVKEVTLQYGATASLEEGSTIDLTSPRPVLTVTSENGETRDYVITFSEFEESLVGEWHMDPKGGNAIWMFGGVWTNICVWNLEEKNWSWAYGDCLLEDDNIITFTLLGVDSENNVSYGSVYNDPGDDGAYAPFYFTGGGGYDMKSQYRIIPEATSYWQKDLGTGQVTIYLDENYNQQWRSFDIVDNSISLTDREDGAVYNLDFDYKAFTYSTGMTDDNWDDPWNDVGRFVHNLRIVAWLVQKVD